MSEREQTARKKKKKKEPKKPVVHDDKHNITVHTEGVHQKNKKLYYTDKTHIDYARQARQALQIGSKLIGSFIVS